VVSLLPLPSLSVQIDLILDCSAPPPHNPGGIFPGFFFSSRTYVLLPVETQYGRPTPLVPVLLAFLVLTVKGRTAGTLLLQTNPQPIGPVVPSFHRASHCLPFPIPVSQNRRCPPGSTLSPPPPRTREKLYTDAPAKKRVPFNFF